MLSLTQFLSKLNNAVRQKRWIVSFPYSKICFTVANLLKQEGFLQRVELNSFRSRFWVVIRAQKNIPTIRKIQQYSTCSRSIHWRLQDFPFNGFFIVSTSQGIVSTKKAFQNQVGGKVLFRIFS